MYRFLSDGPIRRWMALLAAVGLAAAVGGCGSDRLDVAPAKGKVTYKGKALEFGSVLFQPDKGPPARGQIQSDGTFTLGTYGDRDGAVIGKHKVEVRCSETQKPGYAPPAGEEAPVGKSLIPAKYNRGETSGLTAEVKAKGPNEFTFDLAD